jgi:hypothetical protein
LTDIACVAGRSKLVQYLVLLVKESIVASVLVHSPIIEFSLIVTIVVVVVIVLHSYPSVFK